MLIVILIVQHWFGFLRCFYGRDVTSGAFVFYINVIII